VPVLPIHHSDQGYPLRALHFRVAGNLDE